MPPPDRPPSTRKRLLALNHFANPTDAPGGTRMVELAAHLDEWDTLVVAADRNLFTRRARRVDTESFRTVPTLPYAANGLARMGNWASYAVSATALGLTRTRPDVVLASSPHLLAGFAGWLLSIRHRCGFVFEVRDLWPEVLADTDRLDRSSRTFRMLRSLEEFLYRRADSIVVLSTGVRDHLMDRGVPSEKVHLVPNGADPADLSPSRGREDTRSGLRWSGVVALYAGAHGPANGLEALLDAAASLSTSHPELLVVLLGDGISKPSLVESAELRSLDNVSFLDPVPKSEMADLLSAADIGVHVLADIPLFRYGVSPNKLFDYLAAGLPVLTNTEGEVAGIVRDAGAGVAVCPSGLGDGLRLMLDAGADQRARWGAAGRAWLAENRSRRHMAALLEHALEAALEARRG